MKKRALHVTIHARESSIVELTVAERVQLDEITPSSHGWIARRHGRLLDSGMNTVSLPQGHYYLKTLSDAHLHVVCGGVDTTPIAYTNKDGSGSDPPKPMPAAKGDDGPGDLPQLTID